MKANGARRIDLELDDGRVSQNSGKVSNSFARQLRAVGQALEKFGFSAFDVEIKSGNYLVTAKPVTTERKRVSLFDFFNKCLRRLSLRPILPDTDRRLELRFSPDEIEAFDLHGKTRRDTGQMPDPCGISQLLRTAGSYLENRNVGKEVQISLEGRSVMIRYRTDEGRLIESLHDVEYFYEYWVSMYAGRRDGVKPS